jgi:outer membrane receptor protein involved in Fe transport
MTYSTTTWSAVALLLGSVSSPALAAATTGGGQTAPAAPAAAPDPAGSSDQQAAASGPAAPSAQAAPAAAAPSSQTPDYSGDIIVTAQKREESINRVGLSITALTGAELSKQNIRSVADLSNVVPGLSYTNSNTNTPVYTLRGVGFYENSLGAAPAVTVYVDEVPLPFPVLTTEAGLDVERIEVLKGPQGILFGQNSTGGAINYIAKKPTDTFEAGAELGYGRFNDVTGTAYLSGPLSSTLKARLAVSGERADDWQYSYTRNDSTGKTRKVAGRLLLEWEPSSSVRVGLNVNGWINKSDPQVGQLIGLGLQNNSPTFADGTPRYDNRLNILLNYPLAPRNDRAADWSPNMAAIGDEKMGQVALRADIKLTSGITLTSISSYVAYSRENRADYDGVVPNNDDLLRNSGTIHSFIQELRIAETGSSNFRWVFGGNFEASRANETDALLYRDSTIADYLGQLAGLGQAAPWQTNPFHTNQRMRNYAVFANAEFDLTSQLTVKAGARYTEADRTGDMCTNDSGDGKSAVVFNFLNGFSVLGPGSCYTVLQTRDAQGNVTHIQPLTNWHDTLNEHNLSWRAGIDFKPSPTVLFYANLSKGYKAGGFPAASAVVTDQYAPVVQESVLAYEGGFKASTRNHALTVTGAIYYYDYTNKQLRAQGIYLPFGILNNLQNIPKSDVKGAELEVSLRPVSGLHIDGAVSYNDAKVKRYVGINANGTFGDFAGAPVPFTPKWSLNGAIDYDWRLSSNLRAFVGTTVSYRSKATGAIGGEAIEKIDPYTLVDLRAGIETADGSWRLQVWGKNVTDKYYWTNVVHTFDTIIRYTGRPATFGATLSFRYK